MILTSVRVQSRGEEIELGRKNMRGSTGNSSLQNTQFLAGMESWSLQKRFLDQKKIFTTQLLCFPEEGKVLEVEEISSSSGQAQADVTFNVVTKTKADKSVRGLLFDTTAGNTGVRIGAAKLLLEKFGRPLLWLECRHHTAELVLKPAQILLFGDSNSPIIEDFSNFKKLWPYLEKNEITPLKPAHGKESELKKTTVEFVSGLLTNPNRKDQLPRSDYKELCKLTLHTLGADVPGGFSQIKPGADHKARFMSKVLYAQKMFLLKDLQVDEAKLQEDGVQIEGEFTDEYKQNLERFVKFCSLVYVPYFLSTSFGADAPLKDLNLFKLLNEYSLIDPVLAMTTLTALEDILLSY